MHKVCIVLAISQVVEQMKLILCIPKISLYSLLGNIYHDAEEPYAECYLQFLSENDLNREGSLGLCYSILFPCSSFRNRFELETPARLRFELSIGCFDLVASYFLLLISYQHSELSAFQWTSWFGARELGKKLLFVKNESCYRIFALLVRRKQRFSEV